MATSVNGPAGRPAGVVDIGSNSIRLVVFRSRSRAPVPVFNERVICAIGRRLDRTGRLDAKGVKMALANLPRFAALSRAIGIEDLDIIATAATREASDGATFLAAVEAMFGRPVRQLGGDEEARLGACGVVCGIPDADGIAGDLGGGSLELSALDAGAFRAGCSLPLGHLRLMSELGRKRKALARRIDGVLASAEWPHRRSGRRFYAVGGAWRAIARLHMIQSGYPLRVIHNYRIGADRAAEFCEVVSRLGKASLAAMEAVPAQRASSLPVAALVLQRLIAYLAPEEIVFSALGIREGVMFDRLPVEQQRADPLLLECSEIAVRERRFDDYGDWLFDWVAPLFPGESPADARLRRAVCLLADIGWHEHPDYRAEQVYFRILRLPFVAIRHTEKAKLALAVYRRYGGGMDDHALRAVNALLEPADVAWSQTLGTALRLAEVLCGGKPQLLEGSRLRLGERRLTLELEPASADLVSDIVRNRLARLAGEMAREARLVVT